jgi:hypothetical protein
MTKQTATSVDRDVVKRLRHRNPAMFENDATKAFDPTYVSVGITPLNPISRKRSHIFRVGFCMTKRFSPRALPQSGLPKKAWRRMFVTRGRTGFDSLLEAQAACRGWFVGLVKNRAKTNKRRSPRSRSRGLIDRDVWSWTPATAPNVDSRLIGRRSDRAGR